MRGSRRRNRVDAVVILNSKDNLEEVIDKIQRSFSPSWYILFYSLPEKKLMSCIKRLDKNFGKAAKLLDKFGKQFMKL